MRVVSWLRDIVILQWGFLATNSRKAWAIASPVACLTSVGVGPFIQAVSREKGLNKKKLVTKGIRHTRERVRGLWERLIPGIFTCEDVNGDMRK